MMSSKPLLTTSKNGQWKMDTNDNPQFRNYDPFDFWVDRLGNMEFIEDQKDAGQLNTAYYFHMVRVSSNTGFNVNSLM